MFGFGLKIFLSIHSFISFLWNDSLRSIYDRIIAGTSFRNFHGLPEVKILNPKETTINAFIFWISFVWSSCVNSLDTNSEMGGGGDRKAFICGTFAINLTISTNSKSSYILWHQRRTKVLGPEGQLCKVDKIRICGVFLYYWNGE